jgi:YgiT-type zinc finger domain-containing protein
MKCAICGANMTAGETMVSVDTGAGVVVVRNVPALVCDQCGEDWISDESSQQVEKIVAKAKKQKTQVEVVALAHA